MKRIAFRDSASWFKVQSLKFKVKVKASKFYKIRKFKEFNFFCSAIANDIKK
jgi:hypothetical protein